MSFPAIIVIILVAVSLSLNAITHGKTAKKNFWLSSVDTSIFMGLLYWGGFFS